MFFSRIFVMRIELGCDDRFEEELELGLWTE